MTSHLGSATEQIVTFLRLRLLAASTTTHSPFPPQFLLAHTFEFVTHSLLTLQISQVLQSAVVVQKGIEDGGIVDE
jgi:hypothetical protein